MKLLTDDQLRQLLANGIKQRPVRGTKDEIDFTPVVKLFDPQGGSTWLLTEIDSEDNDVAWGLCDLGIGFPEFGAVSLSELAEVTGTLGLGIERDRYFIPRGPVSAYIAAAEEAGHIVQIKTPLPHNVTLPAGV